MHPDPAGFAAVNPSNPQSWNRYAYVTNDPMDFLDPTGLGQHQSGPACINVYARANCNGLPPWVCGGQICGGWQNFYDPFGLMAVTVVGYNVTQGAFVPDPEFLGTGVQNFTVSTIFGPVAGLNGVGDGSGNSSGTVRATPKLKFKPPSWQNFTHEFLPCYGAQLLDNFVGNDDKTLVTIATGILTLSKPLIGGSFLVAWTGRNAFKAGAACAFASRAVYE